MPRPVQDIPGMPKPPEGFYWLVVKNETFGIFPLVLLRKKSRLGRFFDQEHAGKWTNDNFPTVEAKIVWLAKRILEDLEKRETFRQTVHRLTGRYE